MTLTKSETAHRTAGLVYCLWLLGILFGVTAVIGVIISHTHLAKARDTHAYSHFIWQICSFWLVLAGVVATVILWPHTAAKVLAIGCFFVWLFSGLFGSWYLSKSKRVRVFDHKHRPNRHSHNHHEAHGTSRANL